MGRVKHSSEVRVRWFPLAMLALVAVVCALMMVPQQALAATGSGSEGIDPAECAQSLGTYADTTSYVSCLPSGRWGQTIGVINMRTEASGGLFGSLSSIGNYISIVQRTLLPNIMLTFMQICWSMTLSLSQFAASFEILDKAGAMIDETIRALVESMFSAGDAHGAASWSAILAALVAASILSAIVVAVWRGQTAVGLRRIGVTVLALGMLLFSGMQASQVSHVDVPGVKGGVTNSPHVGSPWWMVRTINSAVNKVGAQLDFSDSLLNNNDSLMAANTAKNGSVVSCRDYLYQMQETYKRGQPKADNSTLLSQANNAQASAITLAVDRLWQETALRGWVNMQYGNTTESVTTSYGVAENSLQAYCHILEMKANTSTEQQRLLTNKAYGTKINADTGRMIFSHDGWADPYSRYVYTKDSKDTTPAGGDNTLREYRAAMFWETCSTQGSKVVARDGWSKLIHNISDANSGDIKGNGGALLRPGVDNEDTVSVLNQAPEFSAGSSTDASSEVRNLCQTVFSNPKGFAGSRTVTLDDYLNSLKGLTKAEASAASSCAITLPGVDLLSDQSCFTALPKMAQEAIKSWVTAYKAVTGAEIETKYDLAAALGWRFDIPNHEATWNEANMQSPSNPSEQAVKTTVDIMYGNKSIDPLGAFSSMLGGIVALVIFGSFSIVLIFAKTMMALMALLWIVALLLQSASFFRPASGAVKNWARITLNMSLVGVVYSMLANLCTFITMLMLDAGSMVGDTLLFQTLASCSPAIALSLMIITCTRLLKIQNPFNLRAFMTAAGGGAVYQGLKSVEREGVRGLRRAERMGKRGVRRGIHAVSGGGGRGRSYRGNRRVLEDEQQPQPQTTTQPNPNPAQDANENSGDTTTTNTSETTNTHGSGSTNTNTENSNQPTSEQQPQPTPQPKSENRKTLDPEPTGNQPKPTTPTPTETQPIVETNTKPDGDTVITVKHERARVNRQPM